MDEYDFSVIGYYQRCKTLAKVLGMDNLDDEDRSALVWVLEDCLEQLGQKIGAEIKIIQR